MASANQYREKKASLLWSRTSCLLLTVPKEYDPMSLTAHPPFLKETSPQLSRAGRVSGHDRRRESSPVKLNRFRKSLIQCDDKSYLLVRVTIIVVKT